MVGLLNLVEEDHRIRPAAHRLRELPALLVADIPGWRTDEPRHRVLLGVLTHIDAHHGPLVVEEELGERLRELGLAHACRTKEQEGSGRTIRVRNPSACPAHRIAHLTHGLCLSHNPAPELLLHAQQLLGLALEEPASRDTRPARHHLSDVVGRHLLLDHRAPSIRLSGNPRQLLLEGGNFGIQDA